VYGSPRRSAQLPTVPRSMATMAATKGRSWPKATASRMKGLNFSLFSMNCGAKGVPSARAPTSFALSMITRWPRGSRKPASPVWNQPSASSTSRVASSPLKYPWKTPAPRIRTSPRSAILTSIPGYGRPAVVGLASASGCCETNPVTSVMPYTCLRLTPMERKKRYVSGPRGAPPV